MPAAPSHLHCEAAAAAGLVKAPHLQYSRRKLPKILNHAQCNIPHLHREAPGCCCSWCGECRQVAQLPCLCPYEVAAWEVPQQRQHHAVQHHMHRPAAVQNPGDLNETQKRAQMSRSSTVISSCCPLKDALLLHHKGKLQRWYHPDCTTLHHHKGKLHLAHA